jgi:hypothetical protein
MSSSEPRAAGRRFLVVLFTAFALMLGGIVAATAVVDPTGLLVGAGWREGVCAPGLKDAQNPVFMGARSRLFQPTEIIVGSSRVMRGFEHDDLAAGDGTSAISLGFTAASMADIDGIVRDAIAEAPIERVWIGLDFGAFVLTDRARYPARVDDRSPSPRGDAVAVGLLSPEALQATLNVLLHPGLCRSPPYDARGFTHPDAPPLTATDRAVLPDATARARTLSAWQQGGADRETLYRGEMDRFTRLLAELKRRDIAVIVYVGPTHPAYDSLVDEAGLSVFRVGWRADIARIAAEQGAVLVAADRPDFLATLPDLPSGCAAAPAECAFHDATHFRPFVGAAILREGRRAAKPPRPSG